MDGRKENSFLRGGDFTWSSGSLYNRGASGYYWEPKIYTNTATRDLHFDLAVLDSQYTKSGAKGYGFSIRCVVQP